MNGASDSRLAWSLQFPQVTGSRPAPGRQAGALNESVLQQTQRDRAFPQTDHRSAFNRTSTYLIGPSPDAFAKILASRCDIRPRIGE
jgi:hypothetical protein